MFFKKMLTTAILILGMLQPATQLLGSAKNQSTLVQAMNNFTAKLGNLTAAISQPKSPAATIPSKPIAPFLLKNQIEVEVTLIDSSQHQSLITQATQNRADAIVNPTDPKLKNRGELSKKIINAAGDSIKKWVAKTRKKSGIDEPGYAIYSDAGNLKRQGIKYIIHAFPPNLTYKGNTLVTLWNTYLEIFKLAENLKVATLALPPLSAHHNIGNFNMADIAKTAREALIDYLKGYQPSNLKKIIFVANGDAEFSAFFSAFQNFNQNETKLVAQPLIESSKTCPIRPTVTHQTQTHAQKKPLVFIENMGLLQAAQLAIVDTIVNAANPQLNPGGALSGAIFNAAGSKILTTEIDQMVNNGSLKLPLATTQNAVTSAGNLIKNSIQLIIHAVGPDFETNNSLPLNLVSQTYNNVFKTAKQMLSKKIAIPPISAGIYRGKKQLKDIAAQTAQAFKDFLESNQTESIETILFCTYGEDKNEYDAYTKAFRAAGINFIAS